jgi:hypothetical protein
MAGSSIVSLTYQVGTGAQTSLSYGGSNGKWSATLGPFAGGGSTATITLRVIIADAAGNRSPQASTTVTLNSCTIIG